MCRCRSPIYVRVSVPIVLVLAVLAAGCGGGGLRAVGYSGLPVRSVSPEELFAKINTDGAAVTSLKGKLAMGLQKGTGEEVKRCSGMLLAEGFPERGLYLKGYKRLMPTLFTLVSDGSEFWFHVPRENVAYTGPVEFMWDRGDSLEMYLNAGDLFRALFIRPVDAAGAIEVQADDTSYVVTVYAGGAVARRLWVERKRFNVVRELYYDGGGTEALEIQRKKYVELDGRMYPSSLVLHDLISGSSVFLDFDTITLDPENVPENAFRFSLPNGVEVRRVEEPGTET
jgi:hypothetical protein